MSDLMAFRDQDEPTRDHLAVVTEVAVGDLKPGVQLRVGKVNRDHLTALALAGGEWPPIVVRRTDNTIVDGHYRYLAARQLGHTRIECVYFDGGDESVFFEALRQNRDHGLPLSLRDREAAARQVLAFHPDWSNRRIGATCGLAPGTVSRLRATISGASDQSEQLHSRVGRDGRRRPLDTAASRNRVLAALRAQPDGSLRNTARLAGVSPATVRAVRASEGQRRDAEAGPGLTPVADPDASPRWRSDAAVLSASDGERFGRWFEQTDVGSDWRQFAAGIPVSRIYEVADEARRRSAAWLQFAAMVEGRARGHRPLGTCR